MSTFLNPVLVVEDNLDDFFILNRCFRLAGVRNELRHLENGQIAIDYLMGLELFADRTAHPVPTMVLLDLKLPGKNGFEVLSTIRQQPVLKRVVIAILSSSSEPSDIALAYDLGANAYLVKPSSSEKLTELVRSLEAFWLKHNRFSC